MDSLRGFWDACEAFFGSLTSVHLSSLLFAVFFHVANLVVRTRAWTNILGAAYPQERVRWFDVFGSYSVGVGLNGFVPARGGDVLKVFLIHSRIPGSSYPAIGSSLIAETVFDSVMAFLLITWAWKIGVADGLPGSGLFEFSWLTSHPQVVLTVAIVVAGLVAAALIIYGQRVRAFWDRVSQGLSILKDRRRYVRTVVSLQATGWACRIISAVYFLKAFHVEATLKNALLVIVIGSIATGMPLTPGGLGPKQALAVAVLGTEGTRSTVLAFSIGMELTILAFNLLLAILCLSVMMKGVRLRDALKHARAERAAADGKAPPPDPAETARSRGPSRRQRRKERKRRDRDRDTRPSDDEWTWPE